MNKRQKFILGGMLAFITISFFAFTIDLTESTSRASYDQAFLSLNYLAILTAGLLLMFGKTK